MPEPAAGMPANTDAPIVGDVDRQALERLPQALWRRYLISVLIHLVALSAILVVGEVSLREQAENAERITVAGRIRAVSERMLALAPIEAPEIEDQVEQLNARLTESVDYIALSPGPATQAVLAAPAGDMTFVEQLRALSEAAVQDRVAWVSSHWDRQLFSRHLDQLARAAATDARDNSRSMGLLTAALLAGILLIIAIKSFLVFRPGNRAIGAALTALIDRTERLERARADIAAKNRRLDAALAEAEALRREQSEFTYAISHDLKSPANTIGLLLDEIAEDEANRLGPDSQEFMAMARATVTRMRALVDSVLIYSRATGEASQPQPVALAAAVAEALADLRADIRDHGATITCDPDLPVVEGNPLLLRLLVQNLISNAIKFRDPARPPVVHVGCHGPDDSDCYHLSVTDNGIGIPEGDRDRIFGLFQRLHLRDAYPGSGIGLALCRRIVASHRGTISVRSAEGPGTVFDVTLHGKAA